MLTGAAVALAVALLLGTLGVFAAEGARERRAEARAEVPIDEGSPIPQAHLLVASSGVATFRQREILTRYLAPIGERPPVPPWLTRVPRPGEMAVSPELRDLLVDPDGALLRPRYPERIVQVIDDAWLIQPGELIAYIGARPQEIRQGVYEVVTSFGPAAFERVHGPTRDETSTLAGRLEDPLFQTLLLTCIGLLVPIAAMIATATRLSASKREARLAAIRLVGGTPGQVRIAASVESVVAGTIGCVLGVALFFAGRPLVTAIAPEDHGWFASDIAPPVGIASGILVGVIAVGWLVSVATLHRVVITPLGVARRAGRSVRVRWRIVTLVAGLAGSSLILFARDRILDAPGVLPYIVVFGSFALTSVGAAAVAPLLGASLADLLRRTTSGTGVLLGARRLRADPRAAGRIVAGLVTVVFGVGLTHGFLSAFAISEATGSFVALRPGVVRVSDWNGGRLDLVSKVGSVAGVSNVVPAWTVEAKTSASTETSIVVDCGALGRIVDGRMPRCASGTVLMNRFTPPFATGTPIELRFPGKRGTIVAAVESVRSSPDGLGEYAGLVIPSSILAEGTTDGVPPSHVWAMTTGSATVERLRNRFTEPGSTVTVTTVAEIRNSLAPSDRLAITPAVEVGTAAALAIVAASMLVAAVDSIGERRRSFAMLAAAGARIGTLRGAIAVEIAMPLLGGVAIAVVTSIVVLRMFFMANAESFDGRHVPIPAEPFVRLVVFAIAATIVATIATFPSLGRAIRPESLRTE